MRAFRARRVAPLLLGSLLATPVCADFDTAFPSPAEAAAVNERTVGVVFERDERVFDLLEDIESSLNLAAGLRIVPIVGRNHVGNVYDLLYLDGVDLALVRSDSIEYVRGAGGLAGARRLTRDVARIGGEKIVVVAGEGHATLDALAGRPVAFGRAGSGEFVTGTLLFESLGIDVEKVEAGADDALAGVVAGELAATVHLLGPDERLPKVAGASATGLHVLPLPPDERLSALYRVATLDARDLPGLIAAGERVVGYSVDLNLVAYAWTSPNERTRRLSRFAEALVDRLAELQGHAFQPEWEDVRLEADTPNLDGSPLVERALAAREAALEQWHARRALDGGSDTDLGAMVVERSEDGHLTMTGESDPSRDENGAERVGRLLDELDARLANPVDDVTFPDPLGRNGSDRAEATPATDPVPDTPDGIASDG